MKIQGTWALLGLVLLLGAGSAHAQKSPRDWYWSGTCPNTSQAPGLKLGDKGFTECVAMYNNMLNTFHNSCGAQYVDESGGNAAAACAFGANWGQGDGVFWFDPATNQNNPHSTVFVRCADVGAQNDGPNFVNWCTAEDHAGGVNAGAPKCKECNEGNPIHPGSGGKFQVEVDYTGAGAFPLQFVRYYNNNRAGGSTIPRIGAGWTHTYSRSISTNGGNQDFAWASREDGKRVGFTNSGGIYTASAAFAERLERTTNPLGWKLTNTLDEVEVYDDSGKLISITNRAGLVQTVTYDPNGTISSVTDAFGRSMTFTADAQRRISTMTVGGNTYTYSYGTTSAGNLVSVAYPDTRTRVYQYNNPSFPTHLTGIVDENGVQFGSYAYDANGMVNSSENAGGANKVTTVNSADRGTRNVSVTRHLSATVSSTRTYTYQSVQGISAKNAVSGPACPTCGPLTATFNTNGTVANFRDWNGNLTSLFWNSRLLEDARVDGQLTNGGQTADSRVYHMTYHPTFRLATGIAEPLRITTNTYDASGNLLTKSIQATTDADGSASFGATPTGSPRTWTYTYNANGQVLTVDGPRTDVSDVTTYTYYANNDADVNKRGHVASVTNAAGHTTTITSYNAHGQPLTMVDANGLTTTMVYDARQRLTSRTVGTEVTTYDYDFARQLTKVTLPDGSFLSYGYDGAHRLTSIQDNLGNRIAYTLDFQGNRTQEQVFDPTNQLAQTRSRVYSSINRLFQELGALGQTTEYGYDNQGNVTSVKDPLNKTTTNQYDRVNRLKQTTSSSPISAVTQYAYNGLDALKQVTDPRNLATTYTLNGLGDVTQQVSPDTGQTTNTYDSGGNLATQTDAKGQVTTYAYDVLNRVTLITFHDGSKQTYAYDQGTNGIGRLSSITETNPANQQTSVIAYAYDQHGRVTSETRMLGGVQYVLGYSYDSFGRMSGLTYPSGRTLTYGFDSLGRVNQLTTTKDGQSQVVVQNVQYHPFGGAKSWTLGNGQVYSRSIDTDGRIASYTLGNSSVAIGYDAASRITGIGANLYGYDNNDRLTSAVLPSSNFGYTYDGVGNRTTKTVGAASETYTYSPTSNRIATAGTRSFVFDANGSTTDDAANQYVYDTRGRMVQATSAIGATTYQVNALGQRIRKTNSLGDTVFHYDTRGKLIAETDPGGVLKRELIYLGDIPVGVVQ